MSSRRVRCWISACVSSRIPFRLAAGEDALANRLERYQIGDDLGDAVCVKLRDLFRIYFFVGGMPSPVAAYTERHDLPEVQRILASITTILQDDFSYPFRQCRGSEVGRTLSRGRQGLPPTPVPRRCRLPLTPGRPAQRGAPCRGRGRPRGRRSGRPWWPLVSSLNAYDFSKYGTRAQQRNMRQVLRYIPRNIGREVRYVNISRDVSLIDSPPNA